jgi:hypothetical protein
MNHNSSSNFPYCLNYHTKPLDISLTYFLECKHSKEIDSSQDIHPTMASSEFDFSQLSEAQQLALQQYTSVTDQDVQSAIPLLQRSQWNVEASLCPMSPLSTPTNPQIDSNCQIL